MDAFISLVIVIIILGFALYFIQKYVPMAGIFKDLLMFVIAVAVLIWVLHNYHSWHL